MQQIEELEEISLYTTYTGKALGGGLDRLQKQSLYDKVILFWNRHNLLDLTSLIEHVDYINYPIHYTNTSRPSCKKNTTNSGSMRFY